MVDGADLERGAAGRAGADRGRARAALGAGDVAAAGRCVRRATLQANQIGDPDALLALRVNGADLSLDHGYPARIIVPALPGVHNTKWVGSIEFEPV